MGAAWGTVAIPREATSASEAMQLADVRMYAQKESRRVATEEKLIGADAMTVRLRRVGDSKAL